MEAMQAAFEERYGYENLTYDIMTGLEEVCEMAGIAVFIYALMRYAASMSQTVAVSFHPSAVVAVRSRRSKARLFTGCGSGRAT